MNSLFKVLFNFPSRYLFAIGLGVIFSLTWSLPRTLSCTPKQLDSRGKPAQRDSRLTGLSPSMGCGPSQGGLGQTVASRGGSPKHHIPRDRGGRRFGAGLCPFHSPLLRASRLFSFPPLINMLKFGGSPCLLSGRKINFRFRSPTDRGRNSKCSAKPDPTTERGKRGGPRISPKSLPPLQAHSPADGKRQQSNFLTWGHAEARSPVPRSKRLRKVNGKGRDAKPTLSQTWTMDEPESAICVQSVDAHMSCSSHSDAQFAAFFIDPRAK